MDNRTETLLELYFSNELSEKETRELRTLLEDDPEAMAEWKWQQQIAQASRQLKLTAPVQQAAPARVVPMWQTFAKLAAAAAVLIAAVVMLPQLWTSKTNSVPEAIAANFKHFPDGVSRDVTANQQVAAEVLNALNLYRNPSKYPEAAEAMEALADRFPDHPEYSLYQGVALTGAKNYAQAIDPLRKAAASNGDYRLPALFYLGLAQSGAGQYKEARQSFEAYLADKQGIPFSERAKKMLKILPE